MNHDAGEEADYGERGAGRHRGRVNIDRQTDENQQDRHRGIAWEDLVGPLARDQYVD